MVPDSGQTTGTTDGAIRTFIAVKVPLSDKLRPVLRELGEMGRAVRPVAASGLHVTLKFLGDTHTNLCTEIESRIGTCVATRIRFDVPVRGLGAFPHLNRPTVVWAGLHDDGTLESIAVELQEHMMDLGFEPDRFRLFRPHITLARINARPPALLRELVERHKSTDFREIAIESVCLIRSELTSKGPVYTTMRDIALGVAK
ncbi:MAG: RNA 2',3'-cyclic phosphodiesterase [Planctomycetota bacterium]|nr:RNA 2',3'-cyclic phosphodiesterase [Planctomycetota bacterium]